MIGWVIYDFIETLAYDEKYEIDQLKEEFLYANVRLIVLASKDIDIIVSNNKNDIFVYGNQISLPRFIIARTGVYTSDKINIICKALQDRGVYCINGHADNSKLLNKLNANYFLGKVGIRVLKTVPIPTVSNAHIIGEHLGFPLILKPANSTQGLGIFLCHCLAEFVDYLRFFNQHQMQDYLAQEFADDNFGEAIRVLVLNSDILCAYKKISGNFKASSAFDDTRIIPLLDTSHFREIITTINHNFATEFYGIDLVQSNGNFYVCDVNLSPSFKVAEQILGQWVARSLVHYTISKVKQPVTSLPAPLDNQYFTSHHIIQQYWKPDDTIISPLIVKDLLSHDECRSLIDYFEKSVALPRSYQGIVDLSIRNCTYVVVSNEVAEKLHNLVTPFIVEQFGLGAELILSSAPLIYKYPVGVGMLPHHDMVTAQELERSGLNGQPVLGGDYTAVIFLNTMSCEEGGRLNFVDLDSKFNIVPQAGTCVLFSVNNVHEVTPIIKGPRYTLILRLIPIKNRVS